MYYEIELVSDNMEKSSELVTKVFLDLYLKHKDDDWYLEELEKEKKISNEG